MTRIACKPLGKSYVADPTTLGQRLRNRRLEFRLSIRKVAKRMGVSKEAYTKWEYGQGTPDASCGGKIIAFLGYNPFQFDTSTLAGKLKAYRYAKGLSQEEAGKALRLNKATVLHIEAGRRLLETTIGKVERLLANT